MNAKKKVYTCTSAAGAASAAEPHAPAEADLFMHLEDALKNPQPVPGLPRVLLIGDSISIGYTIPVRKQLQGKALVFRPPVNCQHTGYGLANLETWLGANPWDAIHFNWGIWDTHMLDANGELVFDEAKAAGPLHIRYTPERYRENLIRLVDILHSAGAALIWASSTPIMSRSGARFDDVAIRNAVAAEVMQAHHIEIDDLYGFVLPQAKAWQSPDQVHFNETGNDVLGERVAGFIRRALENRNDSGKGKSLP